MTTLIAAPPAGAATAAALVAHYVVPVIDVDSVRLHVYCRSAAGAWCRWNGDCRYLLGVAWDEHPQVMTEADYAGEPIQARAGYIDFVQEGQNEIGLPRYGWFYRDEPAGARRWWQPQRARRPWQDTGHFLRGDALLFGSGDSWVPTTATGDDEVNTTRLPGHADLYRHETGCAACRSDVLSQRADWQRSHLPLEPWRRVGNR